MVLIRRFSQNEFLFQNLEQTKFLEHFDGLGASREAPATSLERPRGGLGRPWGGLGRPQGLPETPIRGCEKRYKNRGARKVCSWPQARSLFKKKSCSHHWCQHYFSNRGYEEITQERRKRRCGCSESKKLPFV